MKLLYIAPFPPPISGHSIASKVLYDYLRSHHYVTAIDLSIASENNGAVTFRRSVEVLKALFQIWKIKRDFDIIYLTISESYAGNIKDLFFYLLCFNKLDKFYIHLHGGSIKKLLFDIHPVLRWLNSIAISRLAGVFISGQSHANIFAGMIDIKRIHTVSNFAQDNLFVDELLVKEKFSNLTVIRVLYISGMIAGKGYLHLLQAYLSLDNELKKKIHLDFAGKFDAENERIEFIKRVNGEPGITYHGVVDDATKRSLFVKAHIFCLPTTFLEGQPISILEAYASGCVVVTTGQEGIRDVFTDGVNGYEIRAHDYCSIKSTLVRVISSPSNLFEIALKNRRIAITNYRTEVFTKCVEKVLLS